MTANRVYGLAQSAMFCLFAAVVFLDPTAPLFVSGAVRAAGGMLSGGGILLILIAIRTLGRSIQIAPAPKADAELVTRGVYARLRHPIYTGIAAVVIGLFLRQPSPAVLAATVATLAFLVVKSRFEERLLAGHYPGYAEYRRRTWGVLPFLT